MKNNVMVYAFVVIVLALVGVIGFLGMNGSFSTTGANEVTGQVVKEDGTAEGKWIGFKVPVEINFKNMFDTTSTLDATVKLYSEEPAGWEGENVEFTEDDDYFLATYTASSGTASIEDRTPGTYYAVIELSGYNTIYEMITIPDGTGIEDSLSDYSNNPLPFDFKLSAVGSITTENIEFTLTNDTNEDLRGSADLTVAEDTSFHGYKVIVKDEEGFASDGDNDEVFDEGIEKITLTIQGTEYVVFEAGNVDSKLNEDDDDYTIVLENFVVENDADIEIGVEIETDATGDYVGANDEVWGEGEGNLLSLTFYDDEKDTGSSAVVYIVA